MVTKLKPYNPGVTDLVAGWHVIDASDQVLGRLATRVATLLMGKHRPGYVPHLPSGDFVVITNASKIKLTGDKAGQKSYVHHNQQPGHRKEVPFATLHSERPTAAIQHAVKGMLPKNKLQDVLITRLKVYAGAEHPHSAQVIGAERLAARTREEAVRTAVIEAPKPVPAPRPIAAAPAVAAAEEKPRRVRRPAAPTVRKHKTSPGDAGAAAEKKPARVQRPRSPGAKPKTGKAEKK
jgi:large subunit ribosomal protein L13